MGSHLVATSVSAVVAVSGVRLIMRVEGASSHDDKHRADPKLEPPGQQWDLPIEVLVSACGW